MDIAPAIASFERAVARAVAAIAIATTLRSTSAAIAKKCPDEEYWPIKWPTSDFRDYF